MKHLLATTTILALSAGFASAEVTLSGDARMGIIGGDGVDTAFTSRARVKFSMSGTTDGGLEFGASFRADNAGGAASGTAGEVHISGAFGKLSMGDVDGAAAAAMGQVDGVGLTGLGDMNEIIFIGNGGVDNIVFDANNAGSQPISGDPSALYEYSSGAFGFYASVNQPGFVAPFFGETMDRGVAVAASYTLDAYKFAIGYELLTLTNAGTTWDVSQVSVGADATFGAITLKARYADGGNEGDNGFSQDNTQWSLSGTYTADALAVTAFASAKEFSQTGTIIEESEAYGLGASYDLGGGASVLGGYVQDKTSDTSAFDLGLSFSF